jgi:hypothetical protein
VKDIYSFLSIFSRHVSLMHFPPTASSIQKVA